MESFSQSFVMGISVEIFGGSRSFDGILAEEIRPDTILFSLIFFPFALPLSK